MSAEIKGAKRITMVNRAALKLGIQIGHSLSDARAIFPDLISHDADFKDDEAALLKLAHWFIRYTPFVKPIIVGAKTVILLDLTGCLHLWGSVESLLKDIFMRLEKMGLYARIAIAPNIGAAWAFSLYDARAKDGLVISQKELHPNLANLKIDGLRLDEKTNENLKTLGIKKIGDLMNIPVKSLARRFGSNIGRALNRALGFEDEVLSPIKEIIPDIAETKMLHAVLTPEGLERYINKTLEKICAHLQGQNKGAREITLELYRVDGVRFEILAKSAKANCNALIWQKLFAEKLEQLKENMDFGFGIDLIRAKARLTETLKPIANDLDPLEAAALKSAEAVHRLAERLSARIGAKNVVRLHTRPFYLPEHAQTKQSAIEKGAVGDYPEHIALRRPILLLREPEPMRAIAEVPDGPPRQIMFRKLSFKIAYSTPPERMGGTNMRDYYRIIAQNGERFFVFRQGEYDQNPQWFVHGVG